MANEILSVKLEELNQKLDRLRSRIQTAACADRDWLHGESEMLRQEFTEEERMLRDRLEHSKSGVVAELSGAYHRIQQEIRQTEEACTQAGNREDPAFPAEEKLLVAEYALDFAVQAVNRGLLTALEAMDADLTTQEKEEKHYERS